VYGLNVVLGLRNICTCDNMMYMLMLCPGTKYKGCWGCSKIPLEEPCSQSCGSDGSLFLEALLYTIVIGHAQEALGKG
jgi:hypothetical protein